MTQRINYSQLAPELFQKLLQLSAQSKSGSLEIALLDLSNIRASQLNGCAFCLDMHSKEAKIRGESILRIIHVSIWRESPLFNPRERAALAWTEAVTRIQNGITESAYAEAREQLSEKELAELTFAIGIINAWNRLAISFNVAPGSTDKAYGLDKAGL
jgi:AhpD family alkylhydroperoxidase